MGSCEAGREVSSAGMVLRGQKGCHRLVESLGMRHGLSCLQLHWLPRLGGI